MNEREAAEMLEARIAGLPWPPEGTPEATEEDTPEAEVDLEPSVEAEEDGTEVEDTEEADIEEGELEPAAESEEETTEDEDVAWVKKVYGEDVSPKIARAMREKERTVNAAQRDVAELRAQTAAAFEQMRAQVHAEISSATFVPDEEWEEWADEEVAQSELSAVEAIAAAGEAGGPEAARYVLNRWMMKDPAAAVAFQMQGAALLNTPPEREQVVLRGSDVYADVAQRHPDFVQLKEEMTAVATSMPAEIRNRWRDRVINDPTSAVDFVEHVYAQAKAMKLESQQEDRSKKAAEARAARADAEARDAAVATATASQGRQSKPPAIPGFDYGAFREAAKLPPL